MKRLTLLLLPSLILAAPSRGRAEIMERVIVKVNGDIITLSDFEARQVMAIQGAGIGQDKIESYLRDHNAKILQEAVDDLLIVQRADELEIHLPPEAVKGVIENIKKENHITTDDELREQLRREGMTFDDLKRNISQTYLKRAVLQRELERKVAPTEEDVRAYYEAHKDEYTWPATVHLQEIHIKADAPDAKAKAVEAVTRARAGEDFGELARSFSEPGPASGDLGTVSLKELSPAVQRAAAPLQVGEVSDPVASPDGIHVFKLIARTDATVTPLEEVRNKIRNQLMDVKGNEAYDKYVEELRKNAIIDVKVREVPLQVSRPVGPTAFLEPPTDDALAKRASPAAAPPGAPAAGPPPPSPAADDAEFSTSPQEAPEHVTPPPPPDGQDKQEKKDQPRQ